ncbi:uncharacterized protein LOC127718814 [Mytilus californianus]|uniref:uncharacterized protein LOC127718814 n=1 Tax=Mytilus californianus TaxID=6549 RepID=UPI0022450BA6|nr:uncharacterized protein LOC127718814 [Mytilus californianus]
MAGLYIATIIIYTFFYATFALERPFNNAQYLRSKILDGKFFLKCNISASDRIFKIFAPSNRFYGFCQKGSLKRWMCSGGNIIPHMESNIMTVEVNIRISKENCGEWKCIHGGKQDTVNIKSVEKLCNIMRDVERKPEFKGVALKYYRLKTVFKFSCIIFQRPIGNTVNFLVNYTTVDSLRFYNNRCYNKNRACTARTDICGCSYTDNVFTMRYVLEKTGSVYINTTFGVQMILTGNNGKGVQLTLLRVYDGKEFGKLQTVTVPNAHVHIPDVETVNKDDNNGTGIHNFLLFILLSWIAVGVFWILIAVLVKCRGSFKDTKFQ